MSKLRKLADWLSLDGYIEKLESEYSLSFTKDTISVSIFYGRYSDLADVFVAIDDGRAERYANGEAFRYSVFEFVSVDNRQPIIDRRDGYETAQYGLELLKQNSDFFSVDFLKDIRTRYLELSKGRLPESLRSLT